MSQTYYLANMQIMVNLLKWCDESCSTDIDEEKRSIFALNPDVVVQAVSVAQLIARDDKYRTQVFTSAPCSLTTTHYL